MTPLGAALSFAVRGACLGLLLATSVAILREIVRMLAGLIAGWKRRS